jgi:hypothetical protein
LVKLITRVVEPLTGGHFGAMAVGTVVVVEEVDVVVEEVDVVVVGGFFEPPETSAINPTTRPATMSAPITERIRLFRLVRICSAATFCW